LLPTTLIALGTAFILPLVLQREGVANLRYSIEEMINWIADKSGIESFSSDSHAYLPLFFVGGVLYWILWFRLADMDKQAACLLLPCTIAVITGSIQIREAIRTWKRSSVAGHKSLANFASQVVTVIGLVFAVPYLWLVIGGYFLSTLLLWILNHALYPCFILGMIFVEAGFFMFILQVW
jgi:hypothetical protein